MNELFIFAGELSADLHGEKIIQALLKKDPTLKIFGVGGPRMRSTGMECILPMEAFQVMGFIDVLTALPKLIRNFYFLRGEILRRNPKAALFIDYAEFNMRMESSLRKKNYSGKLIHYISPTVWAWRKNRIDILAKNLDLLLVILPFEPACFAHTPLKVEYVGHPLMTRMKEHTYRENLFAKDKKIIGLFPGSRTKEIVRNFPLMLRAAKRLKQPDLQFVVSLSHPRFKDLLEEIAQKEGMQDSISIVPPENTYDLMKACSLAIAKSGTVILELALHEVPTIVIFYVTALDQFILQKLIRLNLPFHSLPNIILNKEIFPELFGPNLTEDKLFEIAQKWLESPEIQKECRKNCQELRQQLGEKDASTNAAEAIISLVK